LLAINMVAPSRLAWGKNTYISLITAAIVLIFLINWKIVFQYIPLWTFLLFMYLSANIVLLNLLVYSNINHLEVFRIPLNLFIYFAVAYNMISDTARKRTIYNILLYGCLIQAVIGIIHYYFFPEILTGVPGPFAETYIIDMSATISAQTERGLLISPNLFSQFLLLGCFLIVFRDEAFKKKWVFETVFLSILIIGIILSGSRFGLLFSVILSFLFYLKATNKRKMILCALAIFAIVIFHGPIRENISHAYHRTFVRTDGYSGNYISRASKNINAIELLTSDLSSFLISPSREKAYEFKVIKGKKYSDNSFLMLCHNYGVPSVVIIFAVFLYLYRKVIDIKKKGTILLVIYFLTSLYLYNCILFDIWLLFYNVALMLLSRRSNNQHSYGY
jgi:hypothetical protein